MFWSLNFFALACLLTATHSLFFTFTSNCSADDPISPQPKIAS